MTEFDAIVPADALGAFVDGVKAVTDEAKLHLGEDGLATRAVDAATIAMVDATLQRRAFESWSASGDQPLGVDLDRVDDVLSLADSDDLVHLAVNPENRKLEVRAGGLEYTLALIDPDNIRSQPDIPDLDHAATVTVEGSQLARGREAADLVSDHVTLAVDGDARTFALEAAGDTDDVSVTLGAGDVLDMQVAEDAAASSLVSLEYVSNVLGPIGASTDVAVQVGDDLPVGVQYSGADGDCTVKHLIAPRIQGD